MESDEMFGITFDSYSHISTHDGITSFYCCTNDNTSIGLEVPNEYCIDAFKKFIDYDYDEEDY
jgi:hypothetical protein